MTKSSSCTGLPTGRRSFTSSPRARLPIRSIGTAWRRYGVSQSRGALPSGPLLIVVHIASAWVPFTSESKEAIAHYPEIIKEIKLALQECGRRLARYIRRGAKEREEAKKRSYIEQYIPHIGMALREILFF